MPGKHEITSHRKWCTSIVIGKLCCSVVTWSETGKVYFFKIISLVCWIVALDFSCDYDDEDYVQRGNKVPENCFCFSRFVLEFVSFSIWIQTVKLQREPCLLPPQLLSLCILTVSEIDMRSATFWLTLTCFSVIFLLLVACKILAGNKIRCQQCLKGAVAFF